MEMRWIFAIMIVLCLTAVNFTQLQSNGEISITNTIDDSVSAVSTGIRQMNSTWINLTPTISPCPRASHAIAYDSKHDRIILFGGHTFDPFGNETWEYNFNNNTWIDRKTPKLPHSRMFPSMAYDSESDRVIMFGGNMGYVNNDTWAYDYNNNSWQNMNPITAPPILGGHKMTYDSESDIIILFGGGLTGYASDQTWAYNYNNNTWTNMTTATRPPGRSGHSIAYDSGSDRVIIFGGEAFPLPDDTWSFNYNNNTWTKMNPADHPSTRKGHEMAYDSQSDRIVLFGGSNKGNETWTYDFNNDTWKLMNPITTPPIRQFYGMSYDSESSRLVIFGGFQKGGENNDTWAYVLSSTDIYPPHVVSTLPNNNAINVSTNTKVSITWNESMNQTSAESAFSSTPQITCTWSWSGMIQTCTPTSTLQQNNQYKVTISTAAKDISGNAMKSNYLFNFTTGTGGGAPPTVTSTSPSNGSVSVPINANIGLVFSDQMDKSATESAISAQPAIVGTFAWDGIAKTLTWDPNTDLTSNTKYTITISTSAKSQSGTNMQAPYTFSFTTSSLPPDIYPPCVIGTNPKNNDINMSTNTKISIQWNESMNTPSAEGAFSSSPSIICGWSWNGVLQACTPSVMLLTNTKYTVTIAATAKDLAGNSMKNQYTFSFTTGTGSSPTPPTVMSTNPSDGAINVSVDTIISITFDKTMDRTATQGAISASPAITWSIIWGSGDTTITLKPSNDLISNKKYTTTIGTSAKSADGANMAFSHSFSFTTISNDIIPPYVVSVNPANNSKDIDLSVKITIIFSEPMNKTSTCNSISITPGSFIEKVWSDDKTLALTPRLEEGKSYKITISKINAEDLVGNNLEKDYIFSFSTKSGIQSLNTIDITILGVVIIIIVSIIFSLFLLPRKKNNIER